MRNLKITTSSNHCTNIGTIYIIDVIFIFVYKNNLSGQNRVHTHTHKLYDSIKTAFFKTQPLRESGWLKG